MKKILKRFAAIRKRRRLSYQDIEKRTGIPPARMKELESGKAAVTVEELEKLLALYRMTFDQVQKYGRWKRLTVPALALLAAAVLAAGAFHFRPGAEPAGSFLSGEEPAASRLGQPGAATAEQPELMAGGDRGVAEEGAGRPDGAPAGGAAAEAGGPGASGEATRSDAPDPAEADSSSAGTEPDGTEPARVFPPDEPAGGTVVFRFWGNVPYHAERLPRAETAGDARVIDVLPVQHLDASRPDWLTEHDRETLILNAGTSEVWTTETADGFAALREDGYTAIGLGTTPGVYEPLIVEAAGRKIGLLSMAGLIRNAEEIALPTRVGLARAYRTDEVTEAVKRAKEQADVLFVLIDWGRRHGQAPNTSQRLIGNAIIRAGADAVIGNRPVRAQDFVIVDGKPLFYALGHAVSEEAGDGAYGLMVEAVFSPQSDKRGWDRLTVRVGKLEDGVLQFDLTEEDENRLQVLYGDKALPDGMALAW